VIKYLSPSVVTLCHFLIKPAQHYFLL